MHDLETYFDRFVTNISLGEPQVSRLERAASTVMDFLREQYQLPNNAVFLQGSYPNHTAVEPVAGGEYDVDVIVVCAGYGDTADDALDDLERRFRANGNYRDRVVRKKPCVRLEYAEDDVGKFHIDVVPVRPTGQPQPPLQAPRRGEGWHDTAPAEYTQWCLSQGNKFSRTVKIMKRWRDEQQSVRAAIKSIVLQVLVAQYMPTDIDEDQLRVALTFSAMHADLKDRTGPPAVYNPVLPSENLTRRWSISDFAGFKRELWEAVELSHAALSADDQVEAIDKWRELLGEDFPALTPANLGIRLSDYSHAQTPADMGWYERLDSRYAVRVRMYTSRGRAGKLKRIDDENYLVFAGQKLKFKAYLQTPNHVETWWQVANTGGHARSINGLRGDIFKGRSLRDKPLADDTENWESTAYTGVHLIRALLVRDGVVVAKSGWRSVSIFAKRHSWAP